MDKYMEKAVVRSQTRIAEGIFSLWLEAPQIASLAEAGQFVNAYCNEQSRLLPRPISICKTDSDCGLIRLVYRVAGKGTVEFSKLVPGDTIDVLGPLGNGFIAASGIPKEGEKLMLIGGGIGIPPMLGLAASFSASGSTVSRAGTTASCIRSSSSTDAVGSDIDIVLGYRDETFLSDDFVGLGNIYLATEDGSKGIKGTVLDAINENSLKPDIIYACGPTPMLRVIKAYAEKNSITAWLSLEERMACGVGACLGCVVQTEHRDEHSNVRNRRVCADGPVFEATEVII